MKASANVLATNKVPEVKIEHNGKEFSFVINVFGRTNFSVVDYDVFEHINQYWASLPEKEQQEIFDLYAKIRFSFDNILIKHDLINTLSDLVKELLEIHNLEKLQDWISYKSQIHIPAEFETEYVASIDKNTSREKTYTRGDYVKLVTLSLALRCMVPVWGEYVSYIRKETGPQFKEFYAFQLLNKSYILHSSSMEKLRLYIEHMIGSDKFDANNTLNSISSEDYGYWLLSLVTVRRLCIGDLRGTEEKSHLVVFIYKYIIDKIRNTDNNCENIVKEKRNDDKGLSEENRTSTLERYKIRSNVSLGEVVELEYSLRDIRTAAYKITTTLDPELLERSIATSQVLLQNRLLDHQVNLLRWVFKSVISAKGMLYLPKPTIVQALGALEAILWSKGHKYLALLTTATASISESSMVISPVDSKIRVDRELAARLEQLFPYARVNNSRKTGVKEVNLVADTINKMADNVTRYSLKMTAHDSMVEEVFGNVSRKFPIKPDIKNDITRLVIELAERSWI